MQVPLAVILGEAETPGLVYPAVLFYIKAKKCPGRPGRPITLPPALRSVGLSCIITSYNLSRINYVDTLSSYCTDNSL